MNWSNKQNQFLNCFQLLNFFSWHNWYSVSTRLSVLYLDGPWGWHEGCDGNLCSMRLFKSRETRVGWQKTWKFNLNFDFVHQIFDFWDVTKFWFLKIYYMTKFTKNWCLQIWSKSLSKSSKIIKTRHQTYKIDQSFTNFIFPTRTPKAQQSDYHQT